MPLNYVKVLQSSETVPEGEVISQDPPEGEVFDPNQLVTIYVSSGPADAGSSVVTQFRVSHSRPSIRVNFG
jgi:beta-lactam-binding protein with PASTA domain